MLITMCFDLNVKHELLIKLFSSICHNYTGMLTNLKIELLCKMLAGFVKTATFKLTLWKGWHLCYDGLCSLPWILYRTRRYRICARNWTWKEEHFVDENHYMVRFSWFSFLNPKVLHVCYCMQYPEIGSYQHAKRECNAI